MAPGCLPIKDYCWRWGRFVARALGTGLGTAGWLAPAVTVAPSQVRSNSCRSSVWTFLRNPAVETGIRFRLNQFRNSVPDVRTRLLPRVRQAFSAMERIHRPVASTWFPSRLSLPAVGSDNPLVEAGPGCVPPAVRICLAALNSAIRPGVDEFRFAMFPLYCRRAYPRLWAGSLNHRWVVWVRLAQRPPSVVGNHHPKTRNRPPPQLEQRQSARVCLHS